MTQIIPTNTHNPEKALHEKLRLWILRILFKLGGRKTFIDKSGYFAEDDVAIFLGLEKYVEMEGEGFTRKEVFEILKKEYRTLSQKPMPYATPLLQKNIQKLSDLIDLNDTQMQILEFAILLSQYDLLRDACRLLPNTFSTYQAIKALSIILEIDSDAVEEAFKPDASLSRSAILTIDHNTHRLYNKFDIDDTFAQNMIHMDADITAMLKDSVRACEPPTLSTQDYSHISEDLDILIPYLKHALHTKKHGINILLYGMPGTGKTELARLVAEALHRPLYEINYADKDDDPIDGIRRLKAYKSAQALFAQKEIILLYDEAEDIFNNRDEKDKTRRQQNKAWLNKTLETNPIPTIWITNNIHTVDNALIRRFALTIHMPVPGKSKRIDILKKYSASLLDEESIREIAEHAYIAPALISQTTSILKSISVNNPQKQFKKLLNNTLRAQGYKPIRTPKHNPLPTYYRPQLINTSTNLQKLTEGIQKHPNARLCLYGPAGTGKSAFAHYIADMLGKEIVIKKGSDLISKWVGGTEENIARAFEEAREEDAVLIFDEVDSFLAERSSAHRSWEITQVNEMLVQMENFDGVFIATTNLMEHLDQASLRRFDLKLEFGYLTLPQRQRLFETCLNTLGFDTVPASCLHALKTLEKLTPGDFAAVMRQHRFHPLTDPKDLIQRLQDELALKKSAGEKPAGFVR